MGTKVIAFFIDKVWDDFSNWDLNLEIFRHILNGAPRQIICKTCKSETSLLSSLEWSAGKKSLGLLCCHTNIYLKKYKLRFFHNESIRHRVEAKISRNPKSDTHKTSWKIGKNQPPKRHQSNLPKPFSLARSPKLCFILGRCVNFVVSLITYSLFILSFFFLDTESFDLLFFILLFGVRFADTSSSDWFSSI